MGPKKGVSKQERGNPKSSFVILVIGDSVCVEIFGIGGEEVRRAFLNYHILLLEF